MANLTKQETGRQAARQNGDFGFGFPLATLRQEMDQIFDKFFSGSPYSLSSPLLTNYLRPDTPEYSPSLVPSIDMEETADRLIFTAELPGIDENDIELVVSEGDIVLRGEKKLERHSKKAECQVHERRYGSFERRMPLPKNVKLEAVQAEFDRGVLTIEIPKVEVKKAAEKKVKIRAKG